MKENTWTRREFIAKSSAIGLGIAAIGNAEEKESGKKEDAEESLIGVAGMPLVKLGKTGAKVSILGFGAIGVSGRPRVLAAAMNEGVNFIDTAEGYDGSNRRS